MTRSSVSLARILRTLGSAAAFAPCLAAGLGAQSSSVLPAGAAASVDRYLDDKLGASKLLLPVRVQHAYALADLAPATLSVRSLAWRRSNFVQNTIAKSSQTLTVDLSHGLAAPGAMQVGFDRNHGTDRTRVASGTFQWPAAPRETGPAKFLFEVKLSVPFVVKKSAGKSLVVDARVTARSHVVGARDAQIPIDAAGPGLGLWETNGPKGKQAACLDSRNRYNDSLSFDLRGLTDLGGSWHVRYNGVLPNAAGMTMISASGSGDRIGAARLPIDLKDFGMPGCALNTGLEGVWIPWTASALGVGSLPSLTIPKGMGGVAFYDQGFYVDAAANTRGLVACWSSKWTITKQPSPAVATCARVLDAGSHATGTLSLGQAAILELRP